ncbi:MAG: serine hydrolase [Flavobacteriaceae bacterium]
MRKFKLLTTLLCIAFLGINVTAQVTSKSISKNQKEKIDAYVLHLQKRHSIPGVSLAITQKGQTVYKENFGKANIEHRSPIVDESIYRVYSLTKPIVSVAVFQLIEQDKLSLNDEVGKYIKDIPKSWRKAKMKHLLTHSSGFPDMAPYHRMEKLTEKEAKDVIFEKKLAFDFGEKYQYNQTNFWLLQKIIEKLSGEKLEDFIIKNQFEGEKKNVFFSSNSKKIVMHRVTPYFPFETGEIQIDHSALKGRYMFAANGLNITLDEFVKWDQRLRNDELIRKETKEEMWSTFSYSKSNKRFAYGWDKRIINQHDSYGFSGSLITAYRIFPLDDMSIVFLSNGLGSYYNIENIINHIATIVDDDIIDFQNEAFETLLQAIVENGVKSLDNEFLKLKRLENFDQMNLEPVINDVGYQLINQKRMEKAVQVFTFNTKKYPNSANAFDSLGEVYLMTNEFDLAALNYQKSVDLGGTRGNAKKMLEQIKQTKKN